MTEIASWYHANVKGVSRANPKTKSAVGLAAYVTGEELYDEENKRTADRAHPGDVAAWGVLAPAGAPAYLNDRAELEKAWNAVHASEKRINSHLAQHWDIGLYRNGTPQEHAAVMERIARGISDRYKVMVTWSVHEPTGHGDQRNWHGHIAHNMREVGPHGFGPKVRRIVDLKTREDYVRDVRGIVADEINAYLERKGSDERVTQESYERRGIAKEPTKHLGNKQNQLRLKGEASPKHQENEEIRARNAAYDAAVEQVYQKIKAGVTGAMADMFTPDDFADQQKRETALLQAMQEQKDRTADFEKRVADSVDEAKKRERDNQEKIDAQRNEGDIADPQLRYMQALGRAATRDHIETGIRAAAMEGSIFARDRQELLSQIAKEQDADKRRSLELRRDIEAAEYMAVTTDRIIGISLALSRRETEDTTRDREASRDYWDQAKELREERRGLDRDIRVREADQFHDKAMGVIAGKEVPDVKQEMSDSKQEKHDRLAERFWASEDTKRQREIDIEEGRDPGGGRSR